MANFKEAYIKTGGFEGGFVNDPKDRGGMTWAGIARNFWPDWRGWILIDRVIKKNFGDGPKPLEDVLSDSTELYDMVYEFYKNKFWEKYYLDKIDSQSIAEVLYDIKVNGGHPWLWLQRTLNVLNREEKDWEDIEDDGIIGKTTVRILNEACKKVKDNRGKFQAEILILDNVLSFRDNYFTIISEKREKNERFIAGWYTRVMKQRIDYYKKYRII